MTGVSGWIFAAIIWVLAGIMAEMLTEESAPNPAASDDGPPQQAKPGRRWLTVAIWPTIPVAWMLLQAWLCVCRIAGKT